MDLISGSLRMIALEDVIVHTSWLALALWTIAYVADYYLTIYSARLYRAGVQQHIVLEGSLELTPYFQQDVDALRWVSPRFLLALVLSIAGLSVLWILAVGLFDVPLLFAIPYGALFCRELVVLARHSRNLVLFRAPPGGLSGQVAYARWLTLKISAAEHFTFATLFFTLFLVTGSLLLLGGAVGVFSTGWRHRASSRALQPREQMARL